MTWTRAARWLLVGLVPARTLLDLAWGPSLVAGASAGRLGGGALVLAAAGLAAVRWRALRSFPGRWGAALWSLILLAGGLRAEDPWRAVGLGLQLWSPVPLAAAWWAWRPASAAPRLWWAVAAVPVALSLGAWAAGQPARHVLHGWPRLIGAYGNLHSHAMAMAVVSSSAALVAVRSDRRGERLALGVLAGLAGACLVASWARGPMLMAAVALAVGLPRLGAAAWLLALGGATLLVGALRARFADLAAVWSGVPPTGGWGAIGSFRVAIWSEVGDRWVAEGPTAVLFGRGLGGHLGLHRHLDPHSELLSLLTQVGVLGTAVHLGLAAAGFRALARSTHPEARVALGLWVGAAVIAPIGNDVLFRPMVVTWLACLAAAALTPPPEPGQAPGRISHPGSHPPR